MSKQLNIYFPKEDTQMILMSKKMRRKLEKPVCCTGTYCQALNFKQHVQKVVKRDMKSSTDIRE